MRKNLSGKTELANHTRNTSRGKRGVNKAERRVPVPSDDEPAFRHKKKRKRDTTPKPFVIEWYVFYAKRWDVWSRHATAAERDSALAKARRGSLGLGSPEMFRAVDLDE